MEGVFAFFLESAFIGALIRGEKRLGPRCGRRGHRWLAFRLFILVTNAFMQHPVGYAMAPNGTLALSDLGAYLLSLGPGSVCS